MAVETKAIIMAIWVLAKKAKTIEEFREDLKAIANVEGLIDGKTNDDTEN